MLSASITEVQKVLAKPLKPNRKQLSVVRFTGGKIEELTEATSQLIESSSSETSTATSSASDPTSAGPSSTPNPTTAALPSDQESTSEGTTTSPRPSKASQPSSRPRKPVVAATVAEPQRGCPAPDFEAAEVRATRVLEAFLSPIQIADFRSQQCFLSIGADTGHSYIITSRYATHQLARYARSLFDVTEQHAYCVHDWEVPAAEEMLALHLHLQCPTREMFLRGIRDDQDVH